MNLTLTGWSNSVNNGLKPFHKRRHELSVEHNCLLVGNRVVIPSVLQDKVLILFYQEHLGIVRTKMFM